MSNQIDVDSDNEPLFPTEIVSANPPEKEFNEEPAGKRRGRRKKQELAEESELMSDFDSWIQKWDWDVPQMKIKVNRKSPVNYEGTPIAGLLIERENTPFSEKEIQDMFGGGQYEVIVSGPRETKDGMVKQLLLGRKIIAVPGIPKVNIDALPQNSRESVLYGGKKIPKSSGDPLADIVGNQLNFMQRRLEGGDGENVTLLRSGFEKAANMQIKAAQDVISEREKIMKERLQKADDEIKIARDEANRFRDEKDRIIKDMKDEQEKIRSSSNDLLAILLPNAQREAQNNIQMMMTMFNERLSSSSSEYNNRVSSLEKSYEQRLAVQADMFRAQMESMRSSYEGRIQQLQQDLGFSREESKRLMGQLEDTRTRLMEEIQKINKQNDPVEQIGKMGSVFDAITGMKDAIGGGKDEDLGEGIDNPIFKSGLRVFDKILDNIPHITEAITARNQQNFHPQYVPQLPPQPQQVVQQRVPVRPQQEPTKPKVEKVRISREDLEKAIEFINGVLESSPDTSPKDFANMASSSIDNSMLRELSRRDPERVVEELQNNNILNGPSITESGKNFIIEVLKELRKLLT